MSEVVPFRPKVVEPAPAGPDGAELRGIPDVAANHERDGQGPPIGSQAWSCIDCGSFAFYCTPVEWRCYECHRPQRF